MRITIWREFSSNHSAAFTVVGVFESPDTARQAAEELNRLLKSIDDWYHQPENAEALQAWETGWSYAPSLREIEIAQQYDIEWGDFTLDWLLYDDEGRGPIEVLENMVFIDGSESGLGAHPADKLIERLGGQALVDGSLSPDMGGPLTLGEVLFFATCLAPNPSLAITIEAEVHSRMRATRYAGTRLTGVVRHDGRRLNFEGVAFSDIPKGISALFDYLVSQGCTEIECMPVEMRRNDDN